jgi:hypothetical protein
MSLVWTLGVILLLLTLVVWLAALTVLVVRLYHEMRFMYQVQRQLVHALTDLLDRGIVH